MTAVHTSPHLCWYYAATSERVEADYIKGIITKDGRNGTFESLRRGTREDFRVVRRRRVEKEFLPARPAFFAAPLAYNITLPSLYDGAPYYWRPLPLMAAEFADSAVVSRAILISIEERRREWTAPPPGDPRSERMPQKSVALTDIEDVVREAAE